MIFSNLIFFKIKFYLSGSSSSVLDLVMNHYFDFEPSAIAHFFNTSAMQPILTLNCLRHPMLILAFYSCELVCIPLCAALRHLAFYFQWKSCYLNAIVSFTFELQLVHFELRGLMNMVLYRCFCSNKLFFYNLMHWIEHWKRLRIVLAIMLQIS